MNYSETSESSAYCPECDKSISADMYSPYDEMCEDCHADKKEDEKIEGKS